jgi:kynurenine formamidase
VKKADAFGKTPGGWFYSSNTICTPEHGGTHFDAPVHFGEGMPSTAEVPVRQLVGPAVVIDVAAKAAADRDYRLTVADVAAWEARNGRVPRGAIVVLRTGWGARYPDRKSYLGDDTPGRTTDLHFPSYGLEAARFLADERGAGVLGVDTASIDHGPSADFLVHQLAASRGVAGLENLANLGDLPEVGAFLVALPMKIAGGSGGPLRVVAILPR